MRGTGGCSPFPSYQRSEKEREGFHTEKDTNQSFPSSVVSGDDKPGRLPDPVLAEASCQFRRREFDPRVGKIHWGMETLSSVLAWETLWAEKPGGMSPMGSQELDTTEGLNHRRHKETLWR